jgi:uncharacterized protein involved in exopolysaccharide biosynthesis
MTPEPGFDVGAYWRVLHRRLPLLLIPLVVLTGIVGLGSLRLPDEYLIKATVVVRNGQEVTKGLSAEDQITQQLGGIIQTLYQPSSLKRIYETVKSQRPGLTLDFAVADYQKALQIVSTEQGQDLIVDFTYRGGPANYGIAVVNACAEEFRRRGDELVSSSLDVSVGFVQEQLAQHRKRLADLVAQEQQITARLSSDLGDMAPQAEDPALLKEVTDRIASNDAAVQRDTVNIASLEAQTSFIRSQLASTKATLDTTVAPSATETALISRLADVRTQRAELVGRYTEHHPDVLALDREIRGLEQQLATAHKEATKASPPQPNPAYDSLRHDLVPLEAQIEATRAEKAEMQASTDHLRRVAANLPDTLKELARLHDDQDAVRKTYDDLLARRQSLDLNQSFEEGHASGRFDMRLAGNVPPPKPIYPNRAKFALVGLFAGLLLGVGFMLLAEYLDHSIHGTSDLRRWIDAPLLAVLPRTHR